MPTSRTRSFGRKSRRSLFGIIAGASLAAAGFIGTAGLGAHAQAGSYPIEQLMAPQALPDVVQGKADAPVTMIEYASMTCTHCARFHAETYPTLLSKYIETGKVRFILREFPLDPLATAGFMLARCSGGDDKRAAVVDLLFNAQKSWAFVDKPLEALANLMKQTGMSQKDFETCVNNQKLYDQVNKERDDAGKNFGIDATPTFFINGTKYSGELSPDALSKILDPLVAKK